MKKRIIAIALSLLLMFGVFAACKRPAPTPEPEPEPEPGPVYTIDGLELKIESIGEQNVVRSVQMLNDILFKYVNKSTYDMYDGEIRFSDNYNIITNRGVGTSHVWPYTAAIEAVVKLLHNLKPLRTKTEVYDQLYIYYAKKLDELIEGLEYYRGTAAIPSYNGTKEWSILAVERASEKGEAPIEGEAAVYDDQMWLVRELIEAYKITGKTVYLEKAEYLALYTLNGWDQSFKNKEAAAATTNENLFDKNARYLGFPWGHGYDSKHACSNGPFISPLVWLSEIYKDKSDTIKFDVLTKPGVTVEKTYNKSEFYLAFAEATYAFGMDTFLEGSGVFADMIGGRSSITAYGEEGSEEEFKETTHHDGKSGFPLAYNTGTAISGAADLYRVTNNTVYLSDLKNLSDSAFSFFADPKVKDGYYAFPTQSDFDPWFSTVLFRSWVEAYAFYPQTGEYVAALQVYMDFGYDNFYNNGLLPRNLLLGWIPGYRHDDNKKAIDSFSYASNFGILADFELNYKNK